jgi:hypothetical protein
VKNIVTIVETIKFFVVTQYTKLEAAYEIEYATAERARAAYSNSRNMKTNHQSNSVVAAVPVKFKSSSTISSSNREVTAPPPKRAREQDVKQAVIAPAPPKSVSAQDILKSMLDVFKDAYTFLRKLDNGEIFMSKVFLHSVVALPCMYEK